MLGQTGSRKLTQLLRGRVTLRPGGCSRREIVSNQPLVSRIVLANNYDRRGHGGVLDESCLDFAQLDANAAKFHLEVVASQELDCAVRQPSAEVSRLVHPGSASGDKRDRGEIAQH